MSSVLGGSFVTYSLSREGWHKQLWPAQYLSDEPLAGPEAECLNTFESFPSFRNHATYACFHPLGR